MVFLPLFPLLSTEMLGVLCLCTIPPAYHLFEIFILERFLICWKIYQHCFPPWILNSARRMSTCSIKCHKLYYNWAVKHSMSLHETSLLPMRVHFVLLYGNNITKIRTASKDEAVKKEQFISYFERILTLSSLLGSIFSAGISTTSELFSVFVYWYASVLQKCTEIKVCE